jgi:uncharacterized membrane protein YtjA (UPF0391 family)
VCPPGGTRHGVTSAGTKFLFLRLVSEELNQGELSMLYYALVFLVVAIIAGVLGFGGIAGASAGIAQILFFLFLAFLVISLVAGLMRRT